MVFFIIVIQDLFPLVILFDSRVVRQLIVRNREYVGLRQEFTVLQITIHILEFESALMRRDLQSVHTVTVILLVGEFPAAHVPIEVPFIRQLDLAFLTYRFEKIVPRKARKSGQIHTGTLSHGIDILQSGPPNDSSPRHG